MINIVAKITPKTALFAECKRKLQAIVAPTLAEVGCIRFELYTGDNQTCLFLVERFVSQQALDEHYQQAYTKQVFTFYESALAKAVEINNLAEI